jgi:hypothetical protein
MASNPRQPATRAYVDKVFRDAQARTEYCFATWAANQEARLEAKLKEALATIRPPPTVYPPSDQGWTLLEIRREDGRLHLKLR